MITRNKAWLICVTTLNRHKPAVPKLWENTELRPPDLNVQGFAGATLEC